MKTAWRGVFPALTTPFADDEALDVDALDTHLEHMLDAGVTGVIVLGSLGENTSLTPGEKRRVVERAVGVAGGRVPVLAGVCETTTRAGCHFAVECEGLGADGIMLLPSPVYRSDARETIGHLRSVAAATALPVMIYNNPVSYGVDCTPDMLAELAELENVVAVKESTADVRRVTDLINALGERLTIFAGVDDLVVESVVLGAQGYVAGLVNAFPRETVVLFELAASGRVGEAVELYRWFTPLLHLDTQVKLVQAIKLCQLLVGLGTEHVRAPRLPLAGEERTYVERLVEQALETRPELSRYAIATS